MANYTSSKSSNGYSITLTITTRSQSQSSNSSVLNWSLYVNNPSNHYANAKSTGNVKVGGATVWSISGTTVHTGGAGQKKLISSGTRTVSHDSSGRASVAVSASFRTDNQSSGWSIPTRSVSGTYSPASLARLPNAPGKVTTSRNSSTREITATVPVANGNGSKITGYQIRRRYYSNGSWGSWSTSTADSRRQIKFTPSLSVSRVDLQGRAQTAAGWGPWSATTNLSSTYLADLPKAPGKVSATKNASTRQITATCPTATANGTTITGYQIDRRYYIDGKWGSWTTSNTDSSRRIRFYPPDVDMRIEFRGRAKTIKGWGPWGAVSSMTSRDPTVKVLSGGIWKNAIVYVRDGGKWKGALAYVRDGSWKRTGV